MKLIEKFITTVARIIHTLSVLHVVSFLLLENAQKNFIRSRSSGRIASVHKWRTNGAIRQCNIAAVCGRHHRPNDSSVRLATKTTTINNINTLLEIKRHLGTTNRWILREKINLYILIDGHSVVGCSKVHEDDDEHEHDDDVYDVVCSAFYENCPEYILKANE